MKKNLDKDTLIDNRRILVNSKNADAKSFCYKFVDLFSENSLLTNQIKGKYKPDNTPLTLNDRLMEFGGKPTAMQSQLKNFFYEAVEEWTNIIDLDLHECKQEEVPKLYFSTVTYKYFLSEGAISTGVRLVLGDKNSSQVIISENQYFEIFPAKARAVILHEIGHFLGFIHPGDGNIIFPKTYDSKLYTVMSNNPHLNNQEVSLVPKTPMFLDVTFAQEVYGANKNYNNDHTVYKFNINEPWLRTIWDGGGVDLIDLSDLNSDIKIDLREGIEHISHVTANNSFMIAPGSNIENISTGAGNDVIKGNELDNVISPGSGKNEITGGEGRDSFVFNNGEVGSCIINDFKSGVDKIILNGLKVILTTITEDNTSILLGSGYKITLHDVVELGTADVVHL